MDIIVKKNLFFLFSLIVIIPGIISLFLYGLNLSIDFTGGSRSTYLIPKNQQEKTIESLENVYEKNNVDVVTVQRAGDQVVIRTKPLDEKQNKTVVTEAQKINKTLKQDEFETVGPTIGNETTIKALQAIVVASILIMIYIAISFRKVPKPTSSLRFGVITVITLIHDVLVLLGVFSILGHFLHVEVDNLFLTALLTVMGFSVHDTIVVFDRIRENLLRVSGVPFAKIVNDSILQTLVRSLNTSLTAVLVLLALLLFGGESIKWFVVALLIGIISGTYSSIFNAAPLLVLWDELKEKKK
ncbi:MAG TPA: protein translocase subunit SecF [Patescibacteria group bacterium]|nr:protein translocase subunit SecF [Patescibacteria group bacterium]